MSYQDYPPPPNYGQWGPPPQQTSTNATVALVLGICGFVVCPLVCSVLAVIFGKKAYTEIDSSGGRITGRGMAQAGVILGWVGIGLSVLGILAFVAWIVFAVAFLNEANDSFDSGEFSTLLLFLKP